MSKHNLYYIKKVSSKRYNFVLCFDITRHFIFLNPPFLKVLKLKLRGKTLRFKRLATNFFYFKFGITHPAAKGLQYSCHFKRKLKQKFYLFGYNKWTLLQNAKDFISLKPSNLYHWRGIRLVRTKMYRKAGKVSEYR